jgi:NADPH:quinone reductase-like Zn-dependent oxidoreductase
VRALTIDAHGGLEQLRLRTDVPEPTLVAPTDVRVRVHAAALNHLDLAVVRGLPGVTIVPPWVLGADAAGVVDAVGPEVADVAVGDRVVVNPGLSDRTCEFCRAGEQSMCVHFRILGEHRPGAFADAVVVPAVNVRRIPATLDFASAAAALLVGVTAWRMVLTRARVVAGEDVLIWGIGGGVSLAALALVKRLGARAWVTSGSDAKLERAAALGADVLLNHRTTDIAKDVRARTGKRGVDVVIDSVGHDTWPASLGALARGGRLVTCGGTSGPDVATDVRRLFWNQWTIMGSTMGNDREVDAVVHALAEGQLAVPIDSTYPLMDGRAAFERLASGAQFGKVVLRMAEGA